MVVTLAPGVDNVDIHEWPVAPLHHLVAHLLQQHQGQHQRYHHHLKGGQDNQHGVRDGVGRQGFKCKTKTCYIWIQGMVVLGEPV